MDLQIIFTFLLKNIDVIGSCILFLFYGVENFNNLKNKAILEAEKIANSSEVKIFGGNKMDIAIDYFYNKFLTRFVPGWIIGLVFPKEKLRSLLQAEFDKMIELSKKKISRLKK